MISESRKAKPTAAARWPSAFGKRSKTGFTTSMPTKSASYKAFTAAAMIGLFAMAIAFTFAMYSAATPCSRSPEHNVADVFDVSS